MSLHWIALQRLRSVAGDKTRQRGIWIINPVTKPGPVSNPPLLISQICVFGRLVTFSPLSGEICLHYQCCWLKRGFACEKSHPHVCASECNSKCAVAANFGKSFHLFSLKNTPLDNTTLQFRHSSKAQQDLSCAFRTTKGPKAFLDVIKCRLIRAYHRGRSCQVDSATPFVNANDT